MVRGAVDWESGTGTPSAPTFTHCTTLGEALPFPEPQLPFLDSEEGTERPPQPLPASAMHTQAKVKANRGNDAELRFTTGSYHNAMIFCADEELLGAARDEMACNCYYHCCYCGGR